MKMGAYLILILVLLNTHHLVVHPVQLPPVKNVVILAGQSNMSGRGSLLEKLPECNPEPNQILRFAANRTWEVAHDPLHADIDVKKAKFCGVGPGMPFATGVIKRSPGFGTIGLVPCAIRATRMVEWAKGTPLYTAMIDRAIAAAATDGGGAIRALLWYQGEADSTDEEARLYKARLQQFIKDVRGDLDSPLLPVIVVALNYNVFGNATEAVRIAQLETADELPNVKCVDARGLRFNDDAVHLTTAAQVHLAGEMADAFLEIAAVAT